MRSAEVILKEEQINYFIQNIKKEIDLYKKVLEISKNEQECLLKDTALTEIFEFIPRKMALLKEIGELDEKLKPIKDEILRLHKESEKLPPEIVNLIKEVESVLEQTLVIDAKNNEKIMLVYQKKTIPGTPLNISSDNALRAKKAYGNNP